MSVIPNLNLREITAQETLTLRQELLWPDKPISHVRVEGDDVALHMGVFIGSELIGIGSFYPDQDQAQLRKLAVKPAFRGDGLGAKIVMAGAQKMREAGVLRLWCDARQTALGFYQNLGFVIEGPRFEKSGVAYHKASLALE